MLRVVYRDSYRAHSTKIEAGALFRAYAKQALLALAFHVISQKLSSLLMIAVRAGVLVAAREELLTGLTYLRDRVAALAEVDPENETVG
jgi:hypothetical protein